MLFSETPLTKDDIKGKLDFYKFKNAEGKSDTLFFDRKVIGLLEGENNSVYPIWSNTDPIDPDRLEQYKTYKRKFYASSIVDSHIAALDQKIYAIMHNPLLGSTVMRRTTTNDMDISSREESLVNEFRGVVEAACYAVSRRGLTVSVDIHAALCDEIKSWMAKRAASSKVSLGIPSSQYYDLGDKIFPDHMAFGTRIYTWKGGSIDVYPLAAGEMPFSVNLPYNRNYLYAAKLPTATDLANNEIFQQCSGRISPTNQGFAVTLAFGNADGLQNSAYRFHIRVGYVDEGHKNYGDVKVVSYDQSLDSRLDRGYKSGPSHEVDGWMYGGRELPGLFFNDTENKYYSLISGRKSANVSCWQRKGFCPWGNTFAAIIGPLSDLGNFKVRIKPGAGAILTTEDMASGIESMKSMVTNSEYLVKIDTLVSGLRKGPNSYNAVWLENTINLKHNSGDYLGSSNPPEGWDKFASTIVTDQLPDGTSKPCTMIDVGNYCDTIDTDTDFCILPLMSPPAKSKSVSSTYVLMYDADSASIIYKNTITNEILDWATVRDSLPNGSQLGLDLTAYTMTTSEADTYGSKLKWLKGVHPTHFSNYESTRRIVGNKGNYSDSPAIDRFNLRSYQNTLVGVNKLAAYNAETKTMMILTGSNELTGFAKSVFTGASGYSKSK